MSASTPISVTLVGATGLVGSRSLLSILSSSTPFSITTLTRRALPANLTPSPTSPSTKLDQRQYTDLFDAPKDTTSIAQKGGVYITALGTTRAAAGSTEAQEKIDLVLNRDLAKRAKEDGADTIILVSSSGSSATSRFFYPRIKGQLEEDVKALEFKNTIILRPATLLGERTESRPAEAVAQCVFRGLKRWGVPVDSLAIDATDVGAAIAHLAAHPPTEKVTVLWDKEITAYAKEYRQANPTSSL